MDEDTAPQPTFIEHAAEIVGAYVRNNSIPVAEVPNLIRSVHDTLASLAEPEPVEAPAEPLKPPVSIKKSISDDYLISMEDGKQYQSLKRHLAKRGLTPAEYRTKWGLPLDYPMTAPGYSAKRSELAKAMQFGRKRVASESNPAPEPEPAAVAPAPRRGRAKKAA